MDSTSCRFPASRLRALLLAVVLVSLLLASADAAGDGGVRCFNAIFSFGDSLADTGNLFHDRRNDSRVRAGSLPYGQTHFGKPTGRFSDGRLIVDFIAEAMGHELLPPFREASRTSEEYLKHGVNLAYAGATALDADFFAEKGIRISTTHSLSVQMDWLTDMNPAPLPLPPAKEPNVTSLTNALILMGEIGGNDYNYAFFQGKKLDEVKTYVPDVMMSIVSSIYELIELGARTIVVPGNLPIGCNTAYVTAFETHAYEDYTEIGCLIWLNDFAEYHNTMLKEELRRLRDVFAPEVTLIYADYYKAAMNMYNNTKVFGKSLAACCGAAGPYNYDPRKPCGTKHSHACNDPETFISWDGFHMTEAAYKIIADGILNGPYASPPILKACRI